ncbi:MAG: peptidylprolyl isomerase [Methylobacteriaceae bacterium]|nr:peptidylprolyl isomerase [Rhodoblastus sp.]MCC0004493.1 peptidylprolyl isomerase [Methylobacteriaceae bacterium]
MSHIPARSFLRAGAASIALAIALAAGAAPASAKVLAKVNGVEITDEDLAIARDDLSARLPRQLAGPARDKALLDNLIVAKVVAQKAEAEKLAASPEFARKLAYLRDKLLTETYLGKIAETANTDANIQKTYDEVAKSQKPEPEIHARHILVPTEDEAKKALARVKGGEDFAKVATEISKDPGSKGGDLGWFTKDRMVPEFAAAAFKLDKPGDISEPVKSQFGWHVIKLEEKRTKEFPKLDQVRDQVVRYIMQKAEGEEVVKLREAAKIERFDAPQKGMKPEDAEAANQKK